MIKYIIDDSNKRIYEYKVETQLALLLKSIIDDYYDLEPTGGSLHIVLDDDNFEKHHIQYCIDNAAKKGDVIGMQIGNLCLNFTEEDLDVIVNEGYKIIEYFENK